MEERYNHVDTLTISSTRSDDTDEVDVSLSFHWKYVNGDKDALFTIGYSVTSSEDETIGVSGCLNGQSYLDFLAASFDESVSHFDLTIFTNAFPKKGVGAGTRKETSIHIEFDGPMGFRKFIQKIAKEHPPKKGELVPLLKGEGDALPKIN